MKSKKAFIITRLFIDLAKWNLNMAQQNSELIRYVAQRLSVRGDLTPKQQQSEIRKYLKQELDVRVHTKFKALMHTLANFNYKK